MPLQAPAEADYPILDSLMEAVQNHASTEGYAIVKARSKSNSSGNVVKAVLLCDRGGQSRRTPKAQAKRTTNKSWSQSKTKGASNDLIFDTDKTAIEVSRDGEFEAFTTVEEAMNMFS